MRPNDENMVLWCLQRKKRGNWLETRAIIGEKMMAKFENAGYLNRIDDDWEITPQGMAQVLKFLLSAPCF